MSNVLGDLTKKHTLNKRVWINNKLKDDVRNRLLEIADDFIKFIGIPIKIEDIRLTGSMANYNYTKWSDIDLHLIVNFSKLNKNTDLVNEFFTAKKSLWNDTHEIKVKGHEVEVYVENEGEPHHSTGVYSLINNEWVIKPRFDTKNGDHIDTIAVSKKANSLAKEISAAIQVDSQNKLAIIDRLKNKIKRMRKNGLESNGEFSIENIAFKVLRLSGHIKRLYDAAIIEKDKQLSLEQDEC